MIRRIATLLAAVVLLVFGLATAGGADPDRGQSAAVPTGPGPVIPAIAVRATNTLAFRLLPRLGGQSNVVFSPYSIESALAMVDQGAAGSTASEIAKVLGGRDAAALAGANLALANSLGASVSPSSATNPRDTARLLIANGLWVQQGLALEDPFTTTLSHDFGAAPQTVDFAGDATGARQAINSWIASHTGQLIKNLMSPSAVRPQTALVLANAIYLKAHWASPFDKSSTTPGRFTTAAGTTVHAPFMAQPPAMFPYYRGKDFVAVDLPYLNTRLSMLALMPKPGTIAGFERGLSSTSLDRLVGGLQRRFVNLRMPRLRLKLQTNLKSALSEEGMPTAFSDQADFSAITHATSLQIATVEHGADLRVDEAGTVAAAATGISLEPTAVPFGPAVRVTLNHPYLLLLRDDRTGAILFAARVADPTQGELGPGT